LYSQAKFESEPLWPWNIAEQKEGPGRLPVLVPAVAVGFGLLSAVPHFLLQTEIHTPTVWIANGALTGFLLVRPRKFWWPLLLAAWLGGAVALLLLTRSPLTGFGIAFGNVVEVLLAVLLLQPGLEQKTDLASPEFMLRFLGSAVLLAPAIFGLLSAIFFRDAHHPGFWKTFLISFPPHAAGMIVMAPLVLAFYNPGLKKLFGRAQIFRTAGILLLVLCASILVFHAAEYSLRFIFLPLLMLVVFEIGILGAIITILEICIVGAIYTGHGLGPMWMHPGATMRSSILLLQLAIIVLAASIIPFAAMLERQRQMRQNLRQGMRRYQLLADNSRDIVALVDVQGRRRYVSPAIYDVLGWTPEEWTHQPVADGMHRDDVAAFQRMLREMQIGEDRRIFRYRTRHKNGKYLWMEASIRILPEEIGGVRAFVSNIRDISERVSAEKKLAEAHDYLQQQAQRDSLTQLANRRRFDQVLEREWRRGRRTKSPLSLLMVDIDHFKRINDTYGHRAGDQCLQVLAGILRRSARRPNDLAARYGGEEFAVLLPDIDLNAAGILADTLCFAVREHLFEAGVGFPFSLTVSIGIAVMVPEKDVRADRLVEQADLALYAAKQGGRDRVMPPYDSETADFSLHQVQ
jgi:diguanylate cyclase (GGDEF)-like protein/PAS domain S-box-containing protein